MKYVTDYDVTYKSFEDVRKIMLKYDTKEYRGEFRPGVKSHDYGESPVVNLTIYQR